MNHTMKLLDLIDIYRTYHSISGEYKFFSTVNGYSIDLKIDHRLSDRSDKSHKYKWIYKYILNWNINELNVNINELKSFFKVCVLSPHAIN